MLIMTKKYSILFYKLDLKEFQSSVPEIKENI